MSALARLSAPHALHAVPDQVRRRAQTRAPSQIRPALLLVAVLASGLAPRVAPAQPVIAIIDSGVDGLHPALAGRVVSGYDFFDDDFTPDDLLGHGTAMAGIIAASGPVTGVCPTCQIMPLRVVGPGGYGGGGGAGQETVARAIRYAVDQGVRVLFVGVGSIGAGDSLRAAVDYASSQGALIVAPAGSEGLNNTLAPAALSGVVSVVAVDGNGDFTADATVSGRESVAAFGGDLLVLAPGGGTVVASGSSVAAARAAGLAGLALQNDPTLNAAQLAQVLRHGSRRLDMPRWYRYFEFGVLDETRVVDRADAGYADVAVTRLTVFPASPLPLQPDSVRVRVVNEGNVPTGPLALSLTWGGAPAGGATLPSLALGAARDTMLGLPVAVAAGDVELIASVAPIPGEIETGDNADTALVGYTASPVHDVDLDGGALSEPVVEAGVVRLPFSVRNRGNQPELSVLVEVEVDSLPVATFSLNLAVGQQADTAASWVISPPEPTKFHSFTISASIPSSDADPANNEWFADFAVESREDAATLQYADRSGNDFVMDAPWKTVRDTVPVLFFLPQFDGAGDTLDSLRISNYDPADGTHDSAAVFVDTQDPATDRFNGCTVINPFGRARPEGLPAGERATNFWHYIVRVPHSSLASAEPPDIHYLFAEIDWSTQATPEANRTYHRNFRVLKVRFDEPAFPKFANEDRYFDAHVHTIAEQTTFGTANVNGANKNFGGPIAMVCEASYALGLVDVQLRDKNFADFRDKLVVTDHNVFYSARPNDSGTTPSYGPTGATEIFFPGGEAGWYRATLGKLAGEEVCLATGSNQPTPDLRLGHHFLAYDTQHFEGPWHGGAYRPFRLAPTGVANMNTMQAVLTAMRAPANPATGFAYAAHPYLASHRWPTEYIDQACGFGNGNNSATGPAVNSTGDEFHFKGSQTWNTKPDSVDQSFNATGGHLNAGREWGRMNPFVRGASAVQRFRALPNWDAELALSLDSSLVQIGRGLIYNFAETPKRKFIRKLYMSAGTDAHGDFNYTDDVNSTVQSGTGTLNTSAYARVRTYVMASDRPPAQGGADATAQDAYREGNTVLTDGPVVRFELDGNGRHDPGLGVARWHDALNQWDNADGRIGGLGKFDGGRTALVPQPHTDAFIKSRTLDSVRPGAGRIQQFDVTLQSTAGRSTFTRPNPSATVSQRLFANDATALDKVSAIVLRGRDATVDERCITNPIWAVPVKIDVTAPANCPYPANSVTIVFHFPISMKNVDTTKVLIQPLDRNGNSTNPEVMLAAAPGWQEDNGVENGKYTASNPVAIACPADDWDAEQHARTAGKKSYVVVMKNPLEINDNLLNEIARTFVTGEQPTAVLVASFDAEASADAVELRWSTPSGGNNTLAKLYRMRESGGGEQLIATVTPGPDGGRFRDATVEPGETYRYRLGLLDAGRELRGPTLRVVVPPAQLLLNGVRPNPVGDAGTVSFSLPRAGHARLTLYAVSGRLERVLADGPFRPGPQIVAWDGRSRSGTPLAPGVYFLRLEAAGERRVSRVLVLR